MKTSIKILSTICAVVMSLNVNAQQRYRGNEQKQQPTTNNTTPQNSGNQNDKRIWASNNNQHNSNWNVSVNYGNYSNYGNYNNYGYNNYGYNNYYNNNYYSIKKAARNSIGQSANVIGNALQFSDWNDIYSPWLAKAIRHQQYAKQLYFWGDYAGALNHAERAGFLAWNTLSYFNNSNGYNNNPDPYSDPNNPYYRQGNTNQPNTNSDDYGYRKSSSDENQRTNTLPITEAQTANEPIRKTEIDGALPQNQISDKQLLKMSVKDLGIE